MLLFVENWSQVHVLFSNFNRESQKYDYNIINVEIKILYKNAFLYILLVEGSRLFLKPCMHYFVY